MIDFGTVGNVYIELIEPLTDLTPDITVIGENIIGYEMFDNLKVSIGENCLIVKYQSEGDKSLELLGVDVYPLKNIVRFDFSIEETITPTPIKEEVGFICQ